MRIAICDDDFAEVKMISQHIRSHKHPHEVTLFASPIPLLEQVYSGAEFDLVFLDIQMPDGNGWEIAKKLKSLNRNIYIAMVTVLGEYIFDCFDRVNWFAPKPVTCDKILKIIDDAEVKLNPKVFLFKAKRTQLALSSQEIVYIEVNHNNLTFHTLTDCHRIRMTLKSARAILSGSSQFVQIHNSFIINLAYYKCMDSSDIVLHNGLRLRLTRTYRNLFFLALSEYVRGGS